MCSESEIAGKWNLSLSDFKVQDDLAISSSNTVPLSFNGFVVYMVTTMHTIRPSSASALFQHTPTLRMTVLYREYFLINTYLARSGFIVLKVLIRLELVIEYKDNDQLTYCEQTDYSSTRGSFGKTVHKHIQYRYLSQINNQAKLWLVDCAVAVHTYSYLKLWNGN